MTLSIREGDWDGPGPCWVRVVRDEDGRSVPAKPVIVCRCGVPCGIRSHHVHADGRVTASFYHREGVDDGCGFHEFIRLEGYTGPELQPGQE